MENEERPLSELCWMDPQIVDLPNVTPGALAAADYAHADRLAVVVDGPNHLVFAVVPRVLRETGWPLSAGTPDLPLAGSPLLPQLLRGQRLALADATVSEVLAEPNAAEAPLVIAVSQRGRPIGIALPFGAPDFAETGIPDFAVTGILPVALPEVPDFGVPVFTVEEATEIPSGIYEVPSGITGLSEEIYEIPTVGSPSLPGSPPLPPSFPGLGDFEPDRRIFSIAPKPGVCVHADGSWHFADPCPCGNQG